MAQRVSLECTPSTIGSAVAAACLRPAEPPTSRPSSRLLRPQLSKEANRLQWHPPTGYTYCLPAAIAAASPKVNERQVPLSPRNGWWCRAKPKLSAYRGSISALSRHRRRRVHCAGMGVLVLKMTASPSTGTPIPAQLMCRRRCRDRAVGDGRDRAVGEAEIEPITTNKCKSCLVPNGWWCRG